MWIRQSLYISVLNCICRTQHVMFETNTSYLFDPTQAGFTANDAMGIGNGGIFERLFFSATFVVILDKYLALGTQKTIRMIEGPNREKKGGAPALFIECKLFMSVLCHNFLSLRQEDPVLQSMRCVAFCYYRFEHV